MTVAAAKGEFVRFPQEGMDYRMFLARLAKRTKCQTYFEIGVNKGGSIQGIDAACIGVDPQFRIVEEIVGRKPMLQLYQMTSDDFFASHRVSQLFGKPVDIAFLDGMHRFEFLLRDFINTEPETHKGSIIVLHDCFPVNAEMTERQRNGQARKDPRYRGMWTGDVWKLIPILKRFRPDLEISCTNCRPTGLAVIRNLDPKSTILKDNYDAILDEFMDLEMTDENIGIYFSTHEMVEAPKLLSSI
jgi:hypothetical protein